MDSKGKVRKWFGSRFGRGVTAAVAAGLIAGSVVLAGGAIGAGEQPDCRAGAIDGDGAFDIHCVVPQPLPTTVTVTTPVPVPTIVPTTVTTTVTVTPSVTPSVQPSPTASPSPTTTPPISTPPPSPSVSPTLSPTPTGPCPVNATNVPGGRDPWGGCWPGPGNTGVPAGTALTAYTGPCTITVAGTVIDSRRVTCTTLDIRAAGVIIRNSLLDGTDVTNAGSSGASFTITDSTVRNGARDQCLCIGDHNFTARRVEVIGGNRSMYCASSCIIEDSWLHGQQLQGAQHGSGLREEQYTQATHNAIACDYPYADDTTSLGCSAALTGYPDFAPIHHNTIRRNLFLASPMASFCVYGGNTSGKPYSSNSANATYQVFVENVWQRGSNGKCAYYGPVTDFSKTRTGNVWSGNVWADGTAINV